MLHVYTFVCLGCVGGGGLGVGPCTSQFIERDYERYRLIFNDSVTSADSLGRGRSLSSLSFLKIPVVSLPDQTSIAELQWKGKDHSDCTSRGPGNDLPVGAPQSEEVLNGGPRHTVSMSLLHERTTQSPPLTLIKLSQAEIEDELEAVLQETQLITKVLQVRVQLSCLLFKREYCMLDHDPDIFWSGSVRRDLKARMEHSVSVRIFRRFNRFNKLNALRTVVGRLAEHSSVYPMSPMCN